MKRYIIAGFVLVAAVIGAVFGITRNSVNVHNLPSSRMSQVVLYSDGGYLGRAGSIANYLRCIYRTYSLPDMPIPYALTEITRDRDNFVNCWVSVKVGNSIKHIRTKSGEFVGSANDNFVLKSPILIPPNSKCQIIVSRTVSEVAFSVDRDEITIRGYALQPGEY